MPGGPGEVSAGSTLVWPVGQAGFCGDMFNGQRDHEAGGRFATGARPLRRSSGRGQQGGRTAV